MATTFFCDRGLVQAAEPSASSGRAPRLALATCILTSSLSFVDGSGVTVGLPAIANSLEANAADLQWVLNAYLLPFSALQLLGGALGDRYGRRSLLIVGVIVLAVGSVICAVAPTLAILIVGRVVQGFGSALILPNSLAILGATRDPKARRRAIGIWSATTAVANAIGPVLGGWLIAVAGWRTLFLTNLPVAGAAIAFALIALERDRPSSGPPLDLSGAVSITTALGLLVWGLIAGAGAAGWDVTVIGALAAAGCLFLSFLIAEYRKGDAAMVPLTLFSSRVLAGLNAVTFLLYGTLGGLLVLLPYLLIQAGGYSPLEAGAALLPFSVVFAVVSLIVSRLVDWAGVRLVLIVGSVTMAIGLALALRIDTEAGYWSEVFPSVLGVAVGLSLVAAPLTAGILGAADSRHTGLASGLNSALARSGGLVMIALVGGVLSTRSNDLIASAHKAALVGAAICLAAGIVALLTLNPREETVAA